MAFYARHAGDLFRHLHVNRVFVTFALRCSWSERCPRARVIALPFSRLQRHIAQQFPQPAPTSTGKTVSLLHTCCSGLLKFCNKNCRSSNTTLLTSAAPYPQTSSPVATSAHFGHRLVFAEVRQFLLHLPLRLPQTSTTPPRSIQFA